MRYVHLQFLSWYSMAALRLNASIRAVSWSIRVFPTLRTSMPSVVIPTLSSVQRIEWKNELSTPFMNQ